MGCGGCEGCKISMLTFGDKGSCRVLQGLAVFARSVFGQLIVQRVLVAVVAKVANLISDNFSNM